MQTDMEINVDIFLTAEELKSATREEPKIGIIKTITLREAGELPFESKVDRYEIEIEVDREKYKWLPNKTSLRNLVKKFGRKSGDWTEKKIKLYRTEQNVRGEMKGVVNAEPLE